MPSPKPNIKYCDRLGAYHNAIFAHPTVFTWFQVTGNMLSLSLAGNLKVGWNHWIMPGHQENEIFFENWCQEVFGVDSENCCNCHLKLWYFPACMNISFILKTAIFAVNNLLYTHKHLVCRYLYFAIHLTPVLMYGGWGPGSALRHLVSVAKTTAGHEMLIRRVRGQSGAGFIARPRTLHSWTLDHFACIYAAGAWDPVCD